MSRRRFLERIATMIGISVVAPATQATLASKLELQRSPIAGFQYHSGQRVWQFLMIGDTLDLVRETDNAYDHRAVRVDWQGQKLGYVPRIDNAAICHLLDNGKKISAEIVAMRDSENPWDRVSFAVFLAS